MLKEPLSCAKLLAILGCCNHIFVIECAVLTIESSVIGAFRQLACTPRVLVRHLQDAVGENTEAGRWSKAFCCDADATQFGPLGPAGKVVGNSHGEEQRRSRPRLQYSPKAESTRAKSTRVKSARANSTRSTRAKWTGANSMRRDTYQSRTPVEIVESVNNLRHAKQQVTSGS